MLNTLEINNNEHVFFLLNIINAFNSIQNTYTQIAIKWKSIINDSLLLYNAINKADIFIVKQIQKQQNMYLASYRNTPVCLKVVSKGKNKKKREKEKEKKENKKEKEKEKQQEQRGKLSIRENEKSSSMFEVKIGNKHSISKNDIFENEIARNKPKTEKEKTEPITRKYLKEKLPETHIMINKERKVEKNEIKENITTSTSNIRNNVENKTKNINFFNEKLNIFNSNFMGNFLFDLKKDEQKDEQKEEIERKQLGIKEKENITENEKFMNYKKEKTIKIDRNEEWKVHSNKKIKMKMKSMLLSETKEKKQKKSEKHKANDTIAKLENKKQKQKNVLGYNSSDFMKKIKCRIKFIKEYFILSNVRHPTIIKYIGNVINKKKEKFGLVLEHVKGCYLSDYIHKYKQILNNKKIIKILYEISASLNYLHNRNICHGNIQSKNILITKTDTVKICNFQNAFIESYYDYKIKHREKYSAKDPLYEHWNLALPYLTFVSGAKNINTVSPVLQVNAYTCNNGKRNSHNVYTPPEVLRKEDYTFKSDIYSFGILMYELIFNTLPFNKEHVPLFFLISVCSHQRYIHFDMNKLNTKFDSPMFHLSINFILLIKQCLHPIPDSRPNSKYLCEHFKDMLDMLNISEEGLIKKKETNFVQEK